MHSNVSLAEFVVSQREKLGLTQEELAIKSSLTIEVRS